MTSEPLRWRRTILFDNREAPALYIGRTLVGVVWPCPRCDRDDSVILSVRKRRNFTFKCTAPRCYWKEKYSFIRAFELLDEIKIARP